MGQRLDLHAIFVGIMTPNKVYFQPPPTIVMTYPCIVYQRDDAKTEFAGNQLYSFKQRYQVTLICKDPDSVIFEKIAGLPYCNFDRFFSANSLNHDVFVLYY